MSENGSECTYKIQRCIHFYSCLAAFASDPGLAKEFKFALDADNEGLLIHLRVIKFVFGYCIVT